MNKKLDELTKEKEKSKTKSKETYGLEFVPSKETLDAMKEANDIAEGKIHVNGYKNFKEMWDDLIGN